MSGFLLRLAERSGRDYTERGLEPRSDAWPGERAMSPPLRTKIPSKDEPPAGQSHVEKPETPAEITAEPRAFPAASAKKSPAPARTSPRVKDPAGARVAESTRRPAASREIVPGSQTSETMRRSLETSRAARAPRPRTAPTPSRIIAPPSSRPAAEGHEIATKASAPAPLEAGAQAAPEFASARSVAERPGAVRGAPVRPATPGPEFPLIRPAPKRTPRPTLPTVKTGSTEPPAVQVHIGAIEVRARPSQASPPKAPASLAPPRPASLGFHEYAAIRSYRGWRDL